MIKQLLLLLSIISLISLSRGCGILTDQPMREEFKKNLKAPWLVLIVDTTLDRYINGIGYGTLIAENKVFTSMQTLTEHDLSNLRVYAGCKEFRNKFEIDQSCVSKPVDDFTFTKDDMDDMNKEDPIILTLSEPFELNEQVKTIKLLSDNYIDDYDPKNCFTYHSKIVFNIKEKQGGLIVEEYRASLADDGTFGINKDDEVNKIPNDIDCVALRCPYFQDISSEEPSDLNFLGSPVVCPLKSDPDRFIQAGFATNVYRIYYDKIDSDKNEYELLSGNLVDLSLSQKEFHSVTDHAFDN